MSTIVKLLFVCVTIGIGLTLLPPVKNVTTIIFNMFGGVESMSPFLALIVNFWSLILMLAIFVGAIFIMKARSQ